MVVWAVWWRPSITRPSSWAFPSGAACLGGVNPPHQQRPEAEPAAGGEARVRHVPELGRHHRWRRVVWLLAAEELVAGIRRAMGDQEMAASIQRIHALYLDREQQPAEKVEPGGG